MNAVDLLIRQHREVESLFARYEKAEDDVERQEIFEELADKLAIHTTIEEKRFYPASKRGDTQELLQRSVEEHLTMKKIIAELLELEAGDEEFDTKIVELRNAVQDHVQEEENELFPEVRTQLGTRKLEAMGKEMAEMAAELEEGEPRLQVPSQIGEPARI